ncbi:MAG TPA: T9SS type A sorting domain-containing protein [Bacteroidales bacterium]|nr:T9SS type A sorting domain-containing protein [Bacteroidales bacterium]
MKKTLVFAGIITLLLLNLNLRGQTWHTYFGDTLRFSGGTCPDHCPYVDVLYVDHDTLFMSGVFTYAGDLFLKHIAKWHDYQWFNLGITYTNDDMYCMIKYDNKLWVGGHSGWYPNWDFDISFLSCWDGNSWFGPYTTKPNGAVFDLIEHNDTLFACGRFTRIDDIYGISVKAYFDGQWIAIGSVNVDQGSSLEVYNNELLLGTSYTGLYKRSGFASWTSFPGGPFGIVNAMTVDTINNLLYIGGVFDYVADTIFSHNIAMWDSFRWHSLDSGMSTGDVNYKAMSIYRGDLYLGGNFTHTAKGLQVNHIARWDGYNWHSLSNGTNGWVYALTVFKDTLIVGGNFYEVGNSKRALAIAKWHMPVPHNCDYLRPIVYAYEEFGTAKDTFYLDGGEAEVKFYNNNAYADTWDWDFAGLGTASVKDPIYIFTEPGEYNIQVTVTQDGCIKTASRTIYIQLGSEIQKSETPEMQLYPNPTNNNFTVKLYLASYKNVEFKIVGTNGELKEQIKITGETTVISTKGWSHGVYVCNLFVEGKLIKVEKLVFE